MAKPLEELTDELLLDIENCVAGGADTNESIAASLGWGVKKWKDYRYGYGNREHFKVPICDAIKRGMDRQPKHVMKVVEGSMLSRCRWVKKVEKTVVTETVPNPITGELETREKVTLKDKWFPPSETIMIFQSVNQSSGKFVSINNVQNTTVINGAELPDGIEVEVS